MVDGSWWPIACRGFGESIICDAKLNPLNDYESRRGAKSTTHCSCFFGSHIRVTCSEQGWLPIPTQQVRMFGMIQHDILDVPDMLMSTGMPCIQRQLSSVPPFAPCQSQSPSQSCTCQSHISQPGLSDHVRAHLSELCKSELGLSETMSEPHLSGPHLSEPHYQSWNCQRLYQSVLS